MEGLKERGETHTISFPFIAFPVSFAREGNEDAVARLPYFLKINFTRLVAPV